MSVSKKNKNSQTNFWCARINLNGTVIENNTLPTYLEYQATYSDSIKIENKHLLRHGEKDTFKIKVTYKKDITEEELNSIPDGGLNTSFTFEVNYSQADNTKVIRDTGIPWDRIVSLNTEGKTISTTDYANELRFIGANPNILIIIKNGE